MIIDKLLSSYESHTLGTRTQLFQLFMQLHDKQLISTKTLLTELGLSYEEELTQIRQETKND